MTTYKILIVEDEILIADHIARYLRKMGHQVVGIAISFEEAKTLYHETHPDLALLDIRLNGPKTGIDFAHYLLQQFNPIPFIYLTSQLDRHSINLAKATMPGGYLTKPIQKESLYTTIEMLMHQHWGKQRTAQSLLQLNNGIQQFEVPIQEILYLQADHIYVRVHMEEEQYILQRGTLKELLKQLPTDQFIQTHRSFVINIRQVSHWDKEAIYVGEKALPVSRSRRKTVQMYLS